MKTMVLVEDELVQENAPAPATTNLTEVPEKMTPDQELAQLETTVIEQGMDLDEFKEICDIGNCEEQKGRRMTALKAWLAKNSE